VVPSIHPTRGENGVLERMTPHVPSPPHFLGVTMEYKRLPVDDLFSELILPVYRCHECKNKSYKKQCPRCGSNNTVIVKYDRL